MAAEKEARVVEMTSEGLTVKLNVDVSDALTGLKAVQREAKMATRAVAELGEADPIPFEKIMELATRTHGGESLYAPLYRQSTADLVEELSRREGIFAHYKVDHGTTGTVETSDGDRTVVSGPACILVVRD
ncbi:BC1881 family protein [Alkalihalobacillus clausii]|uniref:BC1881 family protein n=1 Tax=Shouchella clausii TaxID=79880 RepID=UPI001C218F01|nr:BC1881 family protein [Shouchella clausii]MBU8597354.1 BC1881 family protein [Shouchella clausii]